MTFSPDVPFSPCLVAVFLIWCQFDLDKFIADWAGGTAKYLHALHSSECGRCACLCAWWWRCSLENTFRSQNGRIQRGECGYESCPFQAGQHWLFTPGSQRKLPKNFSVVHRFAETLYKFEMRVDFFPRISWKNIIASGMAILAPKLLLITVIRHLQIWFIMSCQLFRSS